MDLLKLRPLRAFCEVMRAGSVSEAARRLNVTQPALSKSLQQLELELGFTLFKRHQGRLYPGREAEQLFIEAERLFGHVDHLKAKIEGIRGTREGELSIASIPALSDSLITRAISRFRADRPEVRVRLRSHTASQVVELVAQQQVDLGFVNNFAENISIDNTLIAEAELVCVIPDGHPLCALSTVHVSDLRGHPLLALAPLSPASDAIRQTLNAAGLGASVVVDTNLSKAIYALVEAGAGVAIIDPLARLGMPRSNFEIRPFRPTIRVRAECLTSRFRPLSRLGQQYLDEVRAVVDEVAVSSAYFSRPVPRATN